MEPQIITHVYTIDMTMIMMIIGTGVTVIGFIYAFLRNFKIDINSHIDKLEKRMDMFEKRMDIFDAKIISLEERMFLLSTGKTLSQAILEEKMKEKK